MTFRRLLAVWLATALILSPVAGIAAAQPTSVSETTQVKSVETPRFNTATQITNETVFLATGNLKAVSSETGSLLWDYSINDPRGVAVSPDQSVVYAGSYADQYVTAVFIGNQTENWNTSNLGYVRKIDVSSNGESVYAAGGSTVYRLDADTGQIEWSFSNHSDRVVDLDAEGGTIYSASVDGTIRAIGAGSGTQNWVHSTTTAADAVAADGSTVYASDENGYLYALSGGGVEWQKQFGSSSDQNRINALDVSDNSIIAGFHDGETHGLNSTGGIKYTIPVGSQAVFWSPNTGQSYLGGSDTYAYDDTAEQWSITDTADDVAVAEPAETAGDLSGRVLDQNGAGLSNATVALSQNGTEAASTLTNTTGYYSTTVTNGTYNATASKPGYFNASGQVTVQGDTILNFTLSESDKPYVGGGGTSNDGSDAGATPRGGVLLDDQQTDLNFTVRDDGGGQINYTVFHINASDEFEEVASGQVANNTRVSESVTSLHGANQWYVRVNDSINVQTSSVFRYRTPGIVTVFNGSSLNRLNDRTVDYVIRGANSNYRQEGSTSDGNISLNGVPDERLLVRANATDYYEQTIQVTNPARNYSLLLYPRPSSNIPGSDGNYQQSFSVNDLTGDFPASDSSLEVQARVNGEYQVVASDSFGAVNVATVTLEDGEEYRLAVRNDDRVRSMGDFTGDQSLSSEVVTLTVTGGADDGNLTTDPEGLWQYNASYNDSQQAILAEFDSNDTSIQSVQVKIYERGDEGNVIYDSNYGAVEELHHTQQLDNEQANKTWWVEFQVETNNTTQTARVLVGSGAQDPTGSLPDWIKLALSVIVIMMTGALFSQANIGVGMIVTPLVAGGFVLIGWTGTALTGGTVVVALTVGILVNYGGVR